MSISISQPSISVIVPTYNRQALLDHTLRSFAAQRLPANEFEVIVVDDGSTDDTHAVVSQYQDCFDLHYIYQERNGYQLARARNLGIERARGDICLFIDTGILLASGCLEAHKRVHQANPQQLAVIGYVYGLDVGGQDIDGLEDLILAQSVDQCVAVAREQGTYLDPREWFYQRYNDQLGSLAAPWVAFFGCHISVARSAALEISMFDENFRSHNVEDIEFGYRLHQHGVRFQLERNAESIHYPHERSTSDQAKSTTENVRYMHAKHQSLVTELCLTNRWWELNDSILAKIYARNAVA